MRDDQSQCGCGPCGCSDGLAPKTDRRAFLKAAGAGIAATGLAPFMAGPFAAADTRGGALIPVDKKLSDAWIRGLFERGAKEVFAGKSLDNIGMPCGGIGAGQLYLCGDGTLGCWQIFNDAYSNWIDGTFATYQHRGVAKPVDQGFAVEFAAHDKKATMKTLDVAGFAEVTFTGEYPIGTVRYRESECPVEIDLEAHSPFIPLNAKDSSLPATFVHIRAKNVSTDAISVSVVGWLQNAVCAAFGKRFEAIRTTKLFKMDGCAVCLHTAESPPPFDDSASARDTIAFENFEGTYFGAWTAAGNAFKKKDGGTGAENKGVANSGIGGDELQGTLTSPPFTVNRRFINFLIAGGNWTEKTSVNLVIDGTVVRNAAGNFNDSMAWHTWYVGTWEGKEARIVLVDKMSEGWGTGVARILVDQFEFSDMPRIDPRGEIEHAPDFGTMALACLSTEPPGASRSIVIPQGLPPGELITEGAAAYGAMETRLGLLRTDAIQLTPGEEHTFLFAIAWHFPNQYIGHRFVVTPWETPPQNVGHDYAARFSDATKVVEYVRDHQDRLAEQTRRWRDIYYDSSLPYWLLDRLHSTIANLATGTCQWWKNGRFWAYEGVACCHGTCTHVWNYAQGEASLFPEIARNVREMQDLAPVGQGGAFNTDTGLVGFRGDAKYAADGQCGAVLKAYREHLLSADDAFLRRNWPAIKKALEFSIGRDSNSDGIIEDVQPNTYDIEYFGANTFVGSLYLAALRAGEEMAKAMGDDAFAKRVRAIFDQGSKHSVERLWNGEYFVQDVDLAKYPKDQYKDGCLSDQLFGQTWAHQLGLGYLYPREHVARALDAIWKYNWTPDVGPYNDAHKPFRWFITPGQAGLITCTWPKSDYLTEGTRYREEVWTGIEYQVAANLIWEGKVTEGLAMCRAIHDRYHPDRFNPYNEIECGDHYSRALASWGVYLALAGFQYDGPNGFIAFAPRISPENFQAAFTTAEGWITYRQTRQNNQQRCALNVHAGQLKVSQLSIPSVVSAKEVRVSLAEKILPSTSQVNEGQVRITLGETLTLRTGDSLELNA